MYKELFYRKARWPKGTAPWLKPFWKCPLVPRRLVGPRSGPEREALRSPFRAEQTDRGRTRTSARRAGPRGAARARTERAGRQLQLGAPPTAVSVRPDGSSWLEPPFPARLRAGHSCRGRRLPAARGGRDRGEPAQRPRAHAGPGAHEPRAGKTRRLPAPREPPAPPTRGTRVSDSARGAPPSRRRGPSRVAAAWAGEASLRIPPAPWAPPRWESPGQGLCEAPANGDERHGHSAPPSPLRAAPVAIRAHFQAAKQPLRLLTLSNRLTSSGAHGGLKPHARRAAPKLV